MHFKSYCLILLSSLSFFLTAQKRDLYKHINELSFTQNEETGYYTLEHAANGEYIDSILILDKYTMYYQVVTTAGDIFFINNNWEREPRDFVGYAAFRQAQCGNELDSYYDLELRNYADSAFLIEYDYVGFSDSLEVVSREELDKFWYPNDERVNFFDSVFFMDGSTRIIGNRRYKSAEVWQTLNGKYSPWRFSLEPYPNPYDSFEYREEGDYIVTFRNGFCGIRESVDHKYLQIEKLSGGIYKAQKTNGDWVIVHSKKEYEIDWKE